MEESIRQKQVGRLVQKDLSDIIQRHPEWFGNAFVTVAVVRMTRDLVIARVYLSTIIENVPREAFLKRVNENNKSIRQELARRVRNQLRVVPQLQFYMDDAQQEFDKIEKILSGLDIPPMSTEESNSEDDY
ncbi:MAG: 30S ribosome-binding factor RbfA [Cytophagales bacterium]|nr:MAG: 30S ribosome-binding factor RbfA [Cytophagales bacterium]TAF61246.1 MAG: 30S ribosome-binding factor RbfA [Cytophagales bacterium]